MLCLFTLSSFFLSFSREHFRLHRNPGCTIHFTLDISMRFKYPRRILFLCVYQLNWCGQKGTHRIPFAGTFLMISNFKAIHLLRLLNMSSQELLLFFTSPSSSMCQTCLRPAGICCLPVGSSLSPTPW